MLPQTLTTLMAAHGARLDPSTYPNSAIDFGDVRAECAAAYESAILRNSSHLRRLRFVGKDHRDFLHRMSTNHFNGLADGAGFEAVLPDAKGRIVFVASFVRIGDQTIAILDRGASQSLSAWLERYIFAEDIALEDLTESTCMLELHGPHAASIAAQVIGADPATAMEHHLLAAALTEVWATRLDFVNYTGLRLIVPADRAANLWEELLRSGAHPCGEAAWNILRVEAGNPISGHELNDAHNPWEAGLNEAIHLDKGCYIGQEVIARLDTYEKIKQRLIGLFLADGELPPSETILWSSAGQNAGVITSAVRSTRMKANIGLAYVRKQYLDVGTETHYQLAGESLSAIVSSLPFSPN